MLEEDREGLLRQLGGVPESNTMSVDVRVAALEAANRRLRDEMSMLRAENDRLRDDLEAWRRSEVREVRLSSYHLVYLSFWRTRPTGLDAAKNTIDEKY